MRLQSIVQVRNSEFSTETLPIASDAGLEPGLCRAQTVAMAEPIRLMPSPAGDTPVLPHNVEAEAALLGALMIDNRIVEEI